MSSETTTEYEEQKAYTEAVQSGLYAKKSGLNGKYDNVRKLWEDEITREQIRPYLQKLLSLCADEVRRLRIMDLGCGSADGFELLLGVRDRDASLHAAEIDLIRPETLGAYKGCDLSEPLLRQADEIYGHHPKMTFQQADFTQGLPLEAGARPYDLYFTSFGTFSHHNDDATAVELLADIAKATESYAVVVCDWLGRYSYEWQDLWVHDPAELQNMDYVISYIYEKEEREARRDELDRLTLRLMSRPEADDIVRQASEKAGVDIAPCTFFDRSIFTGRHMDTGDYNGHAQPIRYAVNSLHETNVRTDFESLKLNYVPKKGFDFLNDYFENLHVCWNTLVNHVEFLLEDYDDRRAAFESEHDPVPASYPPALRRGMERMRKVLAGCGWLERGLPRENIIEPQLGYALRELVTDMQRGQGCAHGLVGIFEINRKK